MSCAWFKSAFEPWSTKQLKCYWTSSSYAQFRSVAIKVSFPVFPINILFYWILFYYLIAEGNTLHFISEGLVSGSGVLCLRCMSVFTVPISEGGSCPVRCSDSSSALVSTWQCPGTDHGVFVLTAGMAARSWEQRAAADVKGAREGRDTPQCRGYFINATWLVCLRHTKLVYITVWPV